MIDQIKLNLGEKTYTMLEIDKIMADLKSKAMSERAKHMISEMQILTDEVLIDRHQLETTEARTILDAGSNVPLNGMKGITSAHEKLMRQEILRPSDLELIASFLRDTGRMKHYMKKVADIAPQISSYEMSLMPLEDIEERISTCIAYGGVADHASASLQKIRKKIEFTEDKIKQKLSQFVSGNTYNEVLSDQVISQRNGRYVIPVRSDQKKAVEGVVLDRSRSGGTLFIEPLAIKKLHDELSLLKIEEENEVFKILSMLTNFIIEAIDAINLNMETMANYDFLFAKARLSLQMQGSRPITQRGKRIKLINARHPELGNQAVPLTLDIHKNLVITGPNTGGKTVTMKTIGLAIILNQMGLHIPAEMGSILPIYNQILCDIGDGQSISQNLSTFSAHMTNIISILDKSDENTLVILDEIGAGTDPGEGMGLGIAVLDTLNQKRARLLASTHYNEIKDYAIHEKEFINGSMAFDIKTLKPLYRLSIGETGDSNALLIALRLGMPKAIVEKAHKVTYKEDQDYSEILNTLKETLESAQGKSQNSDGRQEEGKGLGGQVGKQVTTKVTNQVTTKATNKLSHQIDNNGNTMSTSHEDTQKVKPVSSKYGVKKTSQYKVGDLVYVKTMKRQGVVAETENAKGELTLVIMNKKFKVNHKRVVPYIAKEELYPEDYDMSIVLETKDNRKKEKKIAKGKKDIVLEK